MKINVLAAFAAIVLCACTSGSQNSARESFNEGWTFEKDGASRVLDLPHDWGVEGDFAQENPGETGKLPWWGSAVYTKTLEVKASDLKAGKQFFLDIDGAMSDAKVYVGENLAGEWPYGYASWRADLTPYLKAGKNQIRITIDNKQESSRWYPGGGIYRNVWLTKADPVGVAHWGSYAHVEGGTLTMDLTFRNALAEPVDAVVRTVVFADNGSEPLAGSEESRLSISEGTVLSQQIDVSALERWSVSEPVLYKAVTTVDAKGYKDIYETVFGIRDIEFRPDGFYLNGEKTFMKGVCLHHDAGALGAVWNTSAWVRRLTMLKEMGCNAIRTSHNPPAPELLDLCDRMGFLVLDELTDTWTVPKKANGYATLFDEWVEKDLVAMIHRDRNHPSVVLWSIGNECGEQGIPEKWDIPSRLTGICHREDPTRPTTAGNDNLWASTQDYHKTIDVYGFNYKPHSYEAFHEANPGQPVYGSETASCISTRGYYMFPVSEAKGEGWANGAFPFQVSSYDLYAPLWASKPDYEWFYEDQAPYVFGEFVWTGYDYLGEPTPYNLDPSVLTNFHTEEEKAAARAMFASWGQNIAEVPLPSRSSYFGIIDLAGFPKDRYWLYQARWRPELPMAHILPHWNWPGREGQVTPVHVYTSGDSAELFVNGVSKGRKTMGPLEYRLRWDDVVYEPGKVEVVAYKDGAEWARDEVSTTGEASALALSVDFDSEDLVFITVSVNDGEGRMVPTACNEVEFSVSGAELVATDAGDPTSHVSFKSPKLPAFNGLASAIVRRNGNAGFKVVVSSPGLEGASLEVK